MSKVVRKGGKQRYRRLDFRETLDQPSCHETLAQSKDGAKGLAYTSFLV